MYGTNKTRIVCEVSINFIVATEYLQILSEKGLIRYEEGFFITTHKGKVFQEIAEEIKL
jgi:predicted transcriptional regulator